MTGWAVPGFVHLRQVRIDEVGRRVVARHRVSRRVVSITYLSPALLSDTEFRNRFAIDSERLGQVRQTTVARVHQYVECGDRAAVVADHVEGTPLRSVLLEEGAIGVEAAVVMFKDTLRGVAAGHAAGLVHGDLKPEDVILTPAGRVRLVDFGLSTCAGRQVLARSTPFYLAPEQWSGGPATEPGDLYAATVTFFECLVGAPPFHADNAPALATLHECAAPPLDAVPVPVRELVRSGLAKDPAERPHARGLLADLQEAAMHGLGPGWERRGRRELSGLLTKPSHPGDVPVVPVPARHRSRDRNVRLGAVLGGALLLAAGLSSPPLPGVLLPGPSGVSDPQDRPPVLAFPRLPDNAGAWANGKPPAANPPSAQSAAMTEPVPSTRTPTDVRLPPPRSGQPRAGSAVAEAAPVDQALTEPSSAGPTPPAPRTTPPAAQPPASAPAVPPPAPSDQDPQAPAPSEPSEQPPGSAGEDPGPSDQNPGPSDQNPGPSDQNPGPSDQNPSEPSGQGRSAPDQDPQAPAPSDREPSDAAQPYVSEPAEQEPEGGPSVPRPQRRSAPQAGLPDADSVGAPERSASEQDTPPAEEIDSADRTTCEPAGDGGADG